MQTSNQTGTLAEAVRVIGTFNAGPRAFEQKNRWCERFPLPLSPTVFVLFASPYYGGSAAPGVRTTSAYAGLPVCESQEQEQPLLDVLPECYNGVSMDSVAFQPLRRPKIYKRCPIPPPPQMIDRLKQGEDKK